MPRLVPAFLAALLLSAPLMTGCSAGSSDDALAASDLTAVTLTELAESDALGGRTKDVQSQWSDFNIMSGAAWVTAYSVSAEARNSPERVAEASFDEMLRLDEVERVGDRTTKRTKGELGKTIHPTARRVGVDGFLFTDRPDNYEFVEKDAKDLVALLGDPADISHVLVEGKIRFFPEDGEDLFPASASVYVNAKTGNALVFYARGANL